jgi:hypothetical protein
MTSQTASALGSNLLSNPSFESFSGSGSGTVGDPYIITNVNQLQEMKDNLSGYYALGNDINASDTRTWNENLENENEYFGFEPIGTAASRFTGSLDGRGYEISNLYINRSGTDNVGLFGYVGSGGVVENVGLENENVRGQNRVGGLAGVNAGTVSNCYSTSSVSGGDWYVGGLVGTNYGTVSNCYSTGTASCKVSCVGGLVGRNDGTVSNCYSTSSVSGGGGWYAAGLVGYNYGGTVSNCYSTGSVSGTNGIGGLVGNNTGTVSNCYSTGSVSGGDWYVGGLVGCGSGTVSNCYSTGSVSGSLSSVGGLVGGNLGGTVSNCYSTGTVSGGVQDVGGIAGGNYWGGIVSNCYSTGSVSCNGYVGGLVGWNEGTVSGCYSTGGVSGGYAVGGLVGANVGTVSNSFYDENTSGQNDNTGKGEPKTTAEMKNVRTFTDNTWSVGLTAPWDFVGNPYYDENNENIWNINPAINNGYPFLSFFYPIGVSFTLNLWAGWNMISFPVMPDNKDPHSIFPGDYTMFRWDAENKRYVLCTDENIENGVGYWVYVFAAENVVVSGTPVDSLTLSLWAGWNLIGVPLGGANIANPDDTPDGSVLPYAFTWDAENRMYTPPITNLVAGAGYWVYALNSCELRL